MTSETPFEAMPLDEQNRLLRKLADLLRPMLGEIGEVLVKESTGKKPGFIGLLFELGNNKAIVFAEYVDETSRKEHRNKPKNENEPETVHVFEVNAKYIEELISAGKKGRTKGFETTDGLKLTDLGNGLTELFRGCYGEDVDDKDFKIKLLVKPLEKDNKIQSMLYFAVKAGDELQHDQELILLFSKLVEQLVRNALGLAAISDHELRSTVGYLTNLIPQSFNDYVMPQTLAAIYAYVREVVPVTLGATPTPIVDGVEGDIKNKLTSIHKAHHIHVNRAIGGSLKGASVYSLNITTHATDGGSTTTTYPAIAKFSTISEARAEADGLRRMQRYFSRVGKMLPPPLEVYLLKNTEGAYPFETGNWQDAPCISVTPDLEGSVLSEKIAEHWVSPTRRVERFSGYLKQARHFVDEIQCQPFDGPIKSDDSADNPEERSLESPEQRLIEFINSEKPQRFKLLIEGLNFPANPHLNLKCADRECKVVNPVVWLKQILDRTSDLKWKTHPKRMRKTVLAHGDFHTGNLFYSTDGDHLTVLDYDRVAGEHPEEDFARLDASFVAFVFGLSDFKVKANWEKYALPALSLVAGCHPFNVQELEKNIFTRDLAETLGVIRPARPCSFFAASVVKALLIQLKTTYTKKIAENEYELAKEAELKQNQGRNAATWLYLALMLTHLVEDSGDMDDWEPFASALPKP